MPGQPTGTVTLLFSDVEGSTRLLDRLGTERYEEVLQLHRRLLREAFARHDGYEVGTEGDAFFVAFASAPGAVAAAGEGQQALAAAKWPEDVALRVRMGVHTGEPLTVRRELRWDGCASGGADHGGRPRRPGAGLGDDGSARWTERHCVISARTG